MGKHWEADKLDAYGHLSWTVGNEDWTACFDAIRVGDTIRYHVVVDCESGGFTDTLESGEVPATAEGVLNLKAFPGYWADICSDLYIDTEDYGEVEWMTTNGNWIAHLDELVAAGTQPDPNEDDGSAEEAAWYEELERGYAKDRF